MKVVEERWRFTVFPGLDEKAESFDNEADALKRLQEFPNTKGRRAELVVRLYKRIRNED